MVSEESLVKVTGSIRPTIQRAVSFLREQQWIDLLKVGTANAYQVNSDVFGTRVRSRSMALRRSARTGADRSRGGDDRYRQKRADAYELTEERTP